jgi:osmotically-inducible protein OsmY
MQAVKRANQMSLSAVALSVILGCTGTAQKQSASEYVDDIWITSKVKGAFVKDKSLKAAEINVETFKGTVQLSGFVGDPGDLSYAADVARDIKGVTSVKNDLRVK